MVAIAEVQAWAYAAGDIARSYFGRATATRKADNSFVTQADTEIEQMLRERITTTYPDHGTLGEEQGAYQLDSPYVWVIDPIDGTASFVAGLPVWGIAIGLLHHGTPAMGVFYLPITDECYWSDGAGRAFCNDQPLTVSDPPTFDSEHGILVPSEAHRRYRIDFPGKTRSTGSSAAHCCYVANGGHIAALLGYAHLWDIAAVLPIVAGAGGNAEMLNGDAPDTRALLHAPKVPSPVLVGAPAVIARLRPRIAQLPQA